MVEHACDPSYLGGTGRRIENLRLVWDIEGDPVSKI
jgi:hypothetical protein